MAYIEKRHTTNKKGKVTISWRAQVRLAGFPELTKTFKRRAEAVEWARRKENEMLEGGYHPAAKAKHYTVRQMIERYEKNVLYTKTTRERYVENQELQLAWWKQEMGDYTLANVTPAVIAEKRDELTKRGLKAGTVNRYIAALSHVFTKAYKEWDWLPENPMPKVAWLKEPRGRVRVLEDKERVALLEALKEIDETVYYYFWTLLSTGTRRDELRLLKWEDVDFERGRIIIHHTKNNERRSAYFFGAAAELLQKAHALRRKACDYVFPARRANQPISLGRLYYVWYRARAKAGVADFRLHDARHSFASYMGEHGAGLNDLAELLGHKTLNMVKRYTHLVDSRAAHLVQKMNEKEFGGKHV